MDWSGPTLELIGRIKPSPYFGCDTSLTHIFLWRRMTNILVAEQNGVLFRYYRGKTPHERGYGFPLGCSPGDGAACLRAIKQDAKMRGVPLEFCLFDESQIRAMEKYCSISWDSCRGDSDYIYNQENLATLAGRKLHGKKNHVNRFFRLYPEAEYRPVSDRNADDVLRVEEQWHREYGEQSEASGTEETELECIREALNFREQLGIFGGLIYVDEMPVAFTLASRLSDQCMDVHFEKAVGEFARDGAYAAINQRFVSSPEAAAFKYVNREEDMGLPGLRQAKESYHPAFKVKKHFGSI